jgi:glycosyl transferase family 25
MFSAYLINLDHSKDRLAHAVQQLSAASIAFERVSGVVGANVPAHLAPKFLTADGVIASPLRPGEVGCYASHLLVCERVLDRAEPFALVVEDDAVVDTDLRAVVADVVARLPAGWDIVKLCNETCRHPPYRFASAGNGRNLVRFFHQPELTTSYLISAAGARKMLQPGLRIWPVDVDMKQPWRFGLDIWGVSPPPVRASEEFLSTITSTVRHGKRLRLVLSKAQATRYRIETIGFVGIAGCLARKRLSTIRRSIAKRLAPAKV